MVINFSKPGISWKYMLNGIPVRNFLNQNIWIMKIQHKLSKWIRIFWWSWYKRKQQKEPLLLPVCLHSCRQVHLSYCYGIPSRIGVPTSLDFQHKLKTSTSLGSLQTFTFRLDQLRYLDSEIEQLLILGLSSARQSLTIGTHPLPFR